MQPVPEIDINQFEAQVGANQAYVVGDGMGCFSSSRVMRFTETNQLYLQLPQTGCCVYFRIHQT